MSLEEFLALERARLQRFERWWRDNNAKNPELFPMIIPGENVGVWDEALMVFEQ